MRDCWHSMFSDTAPASVAASGCAPPMPPRPAVRIQRPPQLAAEVLAAGFGERLVRALHDALAADVDPAAGRHLAVHHQALAVEFVEVLPRCPLRHEVRVGDQHARRIGVRLEHADRLARLHQQRLVVVELAQRRQDRVEAGPVARRAADAAVHDEMLRILRHFGIEVVLQHAVGGLGEPALARERSTARRADLTALVEAWIGCRAAMILPEHSLSFLLDGLDREPQENGRELKSRTVERARRWRGRPAHESGIVFRQD